MTKLINSLSPATRQAVTAEVLGVLKKKYPESLNTDMSIEESDFNTYGTGEPGPNEVSADMKDYLASRKKK
jgi:hypothetical protein